MLSNGPEQYCTLFDANFLPQGLALHASLEKQAQPFHLWILCMDEAVELHLRKLALPDISLIPLREIETPELLAIKPGRSRGEYCWTLTPFIFPAVFSRAPGILRVTYLDADLFFFAPPSRLLAELDQSGKHVLITDHAFDPEYDQSAANGRFCVQFLTCNRTPEAQAVYDWWGARCLEWCFNRAEDGKFGDQKYLDSWPERFGDKVHVLRQTDKTLGPWNFRGQGKAGFLPVFYHYHSLRIVEPEKVRLYEGYRLGSGVRPLYARYIEALREAKRILASAGIPLATLPESFKNLSPYRRLRRALSGKTKYSRLS